MATEAVEMMLEKLEDGRYRTSFIASEEACTAAFMLLLTNDRELMGDHINSRAFNVIAWVTVVAMIGLTLAMLITQR